MRGSIIVYRLPAGASESDRVTFRHRLIGATTTSWGGKYRHHREGLLETIPHRAILPGVIMVGPDDVARVEEFLEEWRAALLVREVVLASEDLPYFKRRGPTR